MFKELLFVMTLFWITNVHANDEVNQVLDGFHQAAADANYDQYFDFLAKEGIFLGTDPDERWTKQQFANYVKPYFAKGKGWRYVSTSRNISPVKGTKIAFFDELLLNDYYGQCRGSGVLVNNGKGWKILQYNLSVTVPNSVSKQVVSLIGHIPRKVN